MSDEWPKYNAESHGGLPPTEHEEAVPACLDCQTWCSLSQPCRCCLLADMEALTARAEKAEAALERVREAIERPVPGLRQMSGLWLAECIKVALGGPDDTPFPDDDGWM